MSPFALLAAAPAALLQGGQGGGIFFPRPVTEAAAEHDRVFFLIFWIAAFFFALINVGAVVFAVRYRRRRKGEPVEKSPSHNTRLELVWTIIPTIIVCYLFWSGLKGYVDRRTAPPGAYTIYVTGQKWAWSFAYPEGFASNELHAPVGRPVKLVLTSNDVLHSVFIPAFRIKMDAVPGRYTETWFKADEAGRYNLFCAEYCGSQHSLMSAPVIIHRDRKTFDDWVKSQTDLSDLSPLELGQRLYTLKTCSSCHSTDGSKIVGPSFKDLYLSERELEDGSTVTADEDYLRRSILQSTAQVVKGFSPAMPDFSAGPLKVQPNELIGLITFIKAQSEAGRAELEAAGAGAEGGGEQQEQQ
ncbi:MAG: cytochrome c oxidase subunit II [Planctomycetota bacterium]|nr:MAG: cytochrome c oxidase subunit II [Planctomycetota bacterium]